jgi:hypothetical protein
MSRRITREPVLPADLRTPAMDAWMASLRRIDEASRQVIDLLDGLASAAGRAADRVAAGVRLSETVDADAIERRRRILGSLSRLGTALSDNRAAAIRVMVDDEGMTLADVARRYGIPRQIASRLYHGR